MTNGLHKLQQLYLDGFNCQIADQNHLFTNQEFSGATKTLTDFAQATAFMSGMRAAEAMRAAHLGLKPRFKFRIRARGPRMTPVVILHYLTLDYKHFSKTGQFAGTLEDWVIERAMEGANYARSRANQDLPNKYGEKFVIYRNLI